MNSIPFTKMSAGGNDFIIIDNRHNSIAASEAPAFARSVCRRKHSVGADGLILIEPSSLAHFRWRFFNADGSEAEMCGNGGRCVARLAYLKGIAPRTLTFDTLAGTIRAEVIGTQVKLQLPLPSLPTYDCPLTLGGKTYLIDTITVGVPHAVVWVDNLSHCDVVKLGRLIRHAAPFQPAGTNVNFITWTDGASLAMRTYERGVEDETLACGTGAVASALIASGKKGIPSPISVHTRGGEILTVHFSKEAEVLKEVFLEGSARLIYEGALSPEALT